jgi:MSHA biogenesis protein MshQ
MAYANQPILIQVTAKNASGGTTVNYQGSFAKANTLSAWSAAGSAGTANPGGGALSNTALAATAFSAGVGITPVSTPDITRPTYALATLTTAPTDVYFRAVDTDGITSLRTNPVEAGLKVASGRIHIPNAYGSERLALPLTVTVQYYNGSNWLTSLTDSVTSFDSNLSSTTPTPGNLVATVLTGLGSGITVSYPATAAVVAGVRTITLVAPDVSGNANLSLNAPSYLPSSTARATFGIYKSPLIYRRENY